jgi:hypothetical protein
MTSAARCGLTEGPAAAPDGRIYFSDIPFGTDKGQILRFDPRTKKMTVFADDSHKSNGLKFDAKGHLIACEGSDEGGRCVSRWDVRTGSRTVIADRYRDKRFNAPNDLVLDHKGCGRHRRHDGGRERQPVPGVAQPEAAGRAGGRSGRRAIRPARASSHCRCRSLEPTPGGTARHEGTDRKRTVHWGH